MTPQQRAVGCFKGLAIGDAIGKQTETLQPADLHRWYPDGISGFEGTPGDVIPRYAGKRYEWRIGETTDDTEQTLAVATALLATREPAHEAIGRELLTCRKSAHPGVSLWAFIQSGDPARIATEGNGCGAAMRSAPVGLLYGSYRLEDLKRGACQCAIPTHGGPIAIAAAAAVSGAVSAAIDGRPPDDVLQVALAAAQDAPAIQQSLQRIYAALAGRRQLHVFPDRTEIIVPLAIALAVFTQSAQETALRAANLGGDADSVASIGCAIAGAMCPESVNPDWWDVVNSINPGDGLLQAAISLTRLRQAG